MGRQFDSCLCQGLEVVLSGCQCNGVAELGWKLHHMTLVRVETLCGRQQVYHTLGTIEPDGATVCNALSGKRDIEDCWNTILPCHNGTVGEITTGLHHQPRSEEKQRGPARVGRGSYQNLARLETCALLR